MRQLTDWLGRGNKSFVKGVQIYFLSQWPFNTSEAPALSGATIVGRCRSWIKKWILGTVLVASAGLAIADHEQVVISPPFPQPGDNVKVHFSGQLEGDLIVIENVTLTSTAGGFVLTVSRRVSSANIFPQAYAGDVSLGLLQPGHYRVDFYIRDPTSSPPPNNYGPPELAATTEFDVQASGIPTLSGSAVLLLALAMLLLGRKAVYNLTQSERT